MREREFELGLHGFAVGLELLELQHLLHAGCDGGDRAHQACDLEVVRGAREVGERCPDGLDKGRDGELCCGGIEDVDAPGQGEEGDGEVDSCWVDGLVGRVSEWVRTWGRSGN